MSKIAVIDVETTGLSAAKGDRIVQIAVVRIHNGKVDVKNYFDKYINPDNKKIPKRAFDVHGLSNQFLEDKPLFKDIWEELLAFISGYEIVTYNSEFDISFIQWEIARFNSPVVMLRDFKVSCLMKAVANEINNGKWLKLDNACRRYGIDISQRKIHGALVDAMLAAELYIVFNESEIIPLPKTPQITPHREKTARPLPRAFKHPNTGEMVQLNFCKNPNCDNYRIPATNPKKDKDGKPKRGLGNDYRITNSGERLTCQLCKTSTNLVNNRAFVFESMRVQSLSQMNLPSCPNEKIARGKGRGKPCINFGRDIYSYPNLYAKKGKVHSQVKNQSHMYSRRYECKHCKSPFTVKMFPEMGQTNANINEILFRGLMNKGVINRLQEQIDIPAMLIYKRIQFFYDQCVLFDSFHMQKNLNVLKNKHLEISMDRQHYLANWNDKNDNRPTKLVNTSSVENKSRFVLASTLNFDFLSDYEHIKSQYKKLKEHEKPRHLKQYAQYIIEDKDMESDDVGDLLNTRAPTKHLLVQQTYSLMAHLELLKPIYEKSQSINLFADDDEGFEMGICLVLSGLIKSGKLTPILIKADRNNASQMQDKRTWSEQTLHDAGISQTDINAGKQDYANLRDLNLKYWTAELHRLFDYQGNGKSEWITHPFPKAKATIEIKPLMGNLNKVSVAVSEALLQVSTHGVDNYFQMTRRRINMLERPITSATNTHRWNGYASYNPKWVVMLLEILRVYNNYVLTDEKTLKNKKSVKTPLTPAEKLGIANKQYTISDILDFTPLNRH
ncbi:exonuclease domain-containing protein [Thalassotalea crassostreae]|uniref:3'-5' exonuclease n=1 Tax=Thalassotalea crassostreae TaxID=1763536 RepID=UPI000839564D|nr:exonuclease domain-containing protein [Thalassotalea crassostreae]